MNATELYKLRAEIDTLRTDATVLLMRANHESLKTHVRDAQRDLSDALALLDQEQHTKAPALLIELLRTAVRSASHRLNMVEHTLQTDGPNASDLH